MKTYKHLTKEERCLIYLKETHLQQGFIIHQLLTKNTLEENQIVICFYVEVQKLHRSFYSKI
ncbi:hypothetical protein QX180_05000 [Malacoplasma iowae]|uniref:hypothetical protein n=1 Tax=Malacoplasma iowae TaxID=2116 RepID=UPI0038738D0E|nr:hypothetical protein QX180_05000 [Malacoplasma iowae]